ncbi:MAG: DUF262 domain-containing protein [Nannocystis sp.]|nr:DUF262 domain-containing protein [Nannocystis sp.]
MTSGRIRVPVYQRSLQWDASDVLSLFDSIYRGFPVGSLLLHHRSAAPATTLEFGPITIHAPRRPPPTTWSTGNNDSSRWMMCWFAC